MLSVALETLVLVGGTGPSDSVETVGLADDDSNCTLKDFPYNVQEAVAGLVDGKPVVCGGHGIFNSYTDCQLYSGLALGWVKVSQGLAYEREAAASAQLDGQRFWILGKYSKWVSRGGGGEGKAPEECSKVA